MRERQSIAELSFLFGRSDKREGPAQNFLEFRKKENDSPFGTVEKIILLSNKEVFEIYQLKTNSKIPNLFKKYHLIRDE